MIHAIDRWCKLAVCSLVFIYCWTMTGVCYLICLFGDGLYALADIVSNGCDHISDFFMDQTDTLMTKHFNDWKKG